MKFFALLSRFSDSRNLLAGYASRKIAPGDLEPISRVAAVKQI